jgi:hypothetical protein
MGLKSVFFVLQLVLDKESVYLSVSIDFRNHSVNANNTFTGQKETISNTTITVNDAVLA